MLKTGLLVFACVIAATPQGYDPAFVHDFLIAENAHVVAPVNGAIHHPGAGCLFRL